ncbi:MAG: hypothetical protein AAFX46_07695, partial [Cyanobacteria bacterium J06636_27]
MFVTHALICRDAIYRVSTLVETTKKSPAIHSPSINPPTKMNHKLLLLSSLFLLQIPTIPIIATPPSIAQNSICKIEREEEEYSTEELKILANKITVKV